MAIRLASLGHSTYFENHFAERNDTRFDSRWFDFDHYSYEYYSKLRAFRPDVTLIYRPELHTRQLLSTIPGIKIGFSTEPLPKLVFGKTVRSEETDRRLIVLHDLPFSGFAAVYHYDEASRTYCEKIGIPFTGYRPIPINTEVFRPRPGNRPRWDALFIGKSTPHRQKLLGRLKNSNRPFLWIEHGVNGSQLASLFRRARCVLNIHADGIEALEPRVYLAAACGIPVLSEPVGREVFPFGALVVTEQMNQLSWDQIDAAVSIVTSRTEYQSTSYYAAEARSISVTGFVSASLNHIAAA